MARVLLCVRSFTQNQSQREDQREHFTCAAGKDLFKGRWIFFLLQIELACYWYSPACFCQRTDKLIAFPSLSLSSPESRKDFLKTVHSILREKHRRQLLKTESLPLSQQYVPFGGKRLSALKGARPVINRAGKCRVGGCVLPTAPRVPIQPLSHFTDAINVESRFLV